MPCRCRRGISGLAIRKSRELRVSFRCNRSLGELVQPIPRDTSATTTTPRHYDTLSSTQLPSHPTVTHTNNRTTQYLRKDNCSTNLGQSSSSMLSTTERSFGQPSPVDPTDLSSYPMVANIDYTPANDSFSFGSPVSNIYPSDAFAMQPDCSLDSFFDCPVSSVEQPQPSVHSPSYSQAAPRQRTTLQPAQFGTFSTSTKAFTFEELTNGSFPQDNSPTSSLGADGPQLTGLTSPSLSPRSLKRESPDTPNDISAAEPEPKHLRRRGRPRLNPPPRLQRTDSTISTTSSSTSGKASKHPLPRQPHNQVERKYREGLNAELERLRRAVPTLPQSDEGGVIGQPKPSKGMILAGAIEYIHRLERERDAALEQLDRFRCNVGPDYDAWGKMIADNVAL